MEKNLGVPERVLRAAAGGVLCAWAIMRADGALLVGALIVSAMLLLSAALGFCHVRAFLGRVWAARR